MPSVRQVIDVSGDGRQNAGEMPTSVSRDDAVARGTIINGLPITSGIEPDVDAWYRDNVIGGPGSFLIVADGFDAFADAFRRPMHSGESLRSKWRDLHPTWRPRPATCAPS